MKTFFIIALIILLSNLIFSNFLRAEDENSKIIISKIKIEGLQAISTDRIKDSMATEFPSIKPWAKKSEFDERTLKDDVLRIKDLLGNSGYYSSKVDYNLKFNNNKTSVEILIKIDEGDPVILDELNIVIPKGYDTDIEKNIIQSIPIKVNDVFSVFNYEKSKTVINQLLADKGYPKPDVKGEASISRKDKAAKATFQIDPGEKYTFGEIVIKGFSDIDVKLIRREITYNEGSQFNLKDISDSQENIFKLSFFKSVIIDTEFDDENLKVKTIYTLRERKLRTVRVGVGAGTEDILRGQISFNQRNFLGGARSLEIGTKVSFITQNLQAILKQPYFFSRDNELRA
ncbi:MAG: autotransporter assembly complex protein TamA, partial [Thermodesulfobacteriota bacterium]